MVRRSVTSAGAQRFRELLEEEDVTARIVQLVHDSYGPGALPEAWDEFRCYGTENDAGTPLEFTADSPFLEQFTSWLTHTWTPRMPSKKPKRITAFYQVPARTFLARHRDLDPLLARYLNACVATPFSFFEVLSCKAGREFTCCDLICGGQPLVLESEVSTLLRVSQVLYARVVTVDGVAVIDAAAPWPLRGEDIKGTILALRAVILKSQSGVEPAHARQRLLAHDLLVRILYWGLIEGELWEDSSRPPGSSPTRELH